MAETSRLLLVSNRLPVTVKWERGELAVARSSGGLATGLRGPHEKSEGLWIGWPGDTSRLSPPQLQELGRKLEALNTVPVYLSSGEIARFYEGFSNGVLWPIFHYLFDRVPFDTRDWEAYKRVNERFAQAVLDNYRPGDLIWVHDYQLMLLPALLRRRLPAAHIGFFLHIPFPSSEVFRILPWREEVLRGLLGADLIGFHAFSYVRHFAKSVLRVLGFPFDAERIAYEGRDVRLGVFPMGVDAELFDSLSREDAVVAKAEAYRANDQRILLGIDRLDYTKGIPRRILAIERLLEREPNLRGKIRFVQVAVPSREKVEAYAEFRRHVDELVGRVNGAYATFNHVPIHYLYRSFSERQIVSFYRAADVMVVTPFRDGMNLVAKEFVASRSDGDGVLVLSEFAGAVAELGEALIVNPYDVAGMAETLKRALSMTPEERRMRMATMRKRVSQHDVHAWANGFIEALSRTPQKPVRLATGYMTEDDRASLISQLRAANDVALLLDYDGTLVGTAPLPELAVPDRDLKDLLTALARRPNTSVHVVSGRARDSLQEWLGDLPVGLHAEHGVWYRMSPEDTWHVHRELRGDWKPAVLSLFRDFEARTPGAVVEEKSAGLAWHYRMADAEFGPIQARELAVYLTDVLTNVPVEVIHGDKVVEVRQHGVQKGLAVKHVLRSVPDPSGVLAIGNDRTDEDMFAALPKAAHSIHVGADTTRAQFLLATVYDVRRLLRELLEQP